MNNTRDLLLPFGFRFGLQSSPGLAAAARKGLPAANRPARPLPPGSAVGGGQISSPGSSIIVDIGLENSEDIIARLEQRIEAARQPLDRSEYFSHSLSHSVGDFFDSRGYFERW